MKIKRLIAILLSYTFCCISPFTIYAENTVNDEVVEMDIWDGTADTSWIDTNWYCQAVDSDGDGVYECAERELHISTPEQLAGMIKMMGEYQRDLLNVFYVTTIYLDNDIYLNDTTNWHEWDTEGNAPDNFWTAEREVYSAFSGTFDGQGHTIYGIYGDPLFGADTGMGTIKNLIIDEGLIFNSDRTSYSKYYGSFAGDAYNLLNCKNYASVIFTGMEWDVGGIVGSCSNSIQNCCNYGDIILYANGSKSYDGYYSIYGSVSGVCVRLYNDAFMTNCYNQGKLRIIDTGRFDYYDFYSLSFFGVCAYLGDGYTGNHGEKMSNCYNSGEFLCDSRCEKYTITYHSSKMENCYQIDELSQSENMVELLGNAFVHVENDFPKLAWEVYGIMTEGDINNDSTLTVADVVVLQKYLLNVYSMSLDEWNRSNLCVDDSVNVFDLCILKRLLISR